MTNLREIKILKAKAERLLVATKWRNYGLYFCIKIFLIVYLQYCFYHDPIFTYAQIYFKKNIVTGGRVWKKNEKTVIKNFILCVCGRCAISARGYDFHLILRSIH